MKSIIALAALLLTTSASAEETSASAEETAEKFAITYQLDGQESTAQAAGTVVGSISGSTATLTVTPAEGNCITKDQITVIKTIPGDNAQTRTPGVSSPVEITASSTTADPSGVTTYTFDASDANYSYEVTANFLSRKDVADADILLPEDAYFEYQGGDAIEPAISVTYADEALTADKDFTVAYSNNKNAGLGVITITGIGMYKGTNSINFDIHQASVAIWFETADGGEAKELETTFGTTFTEPVLKLDPAGVIEVTYSVDDESVATIDPSTGKLTILKTGTVVVTAAAAKDYANEEGSNYNVTPENTSKSYTLTINAGTVTLTFSKQEISATLGSEFEVPTLTVSPEGITPIEYESTNAEAATVNKNTGAVTLVGEGETTIKAVFPGNENYEAAETFYMLTVNKATATLSFSAETATATMGQAFTAPTLTVTPEGLQGITYSSSNTDVATIAEDGKVTIVGAGETTIKATFAGNDTYEAAEASYVLTVSKATATLAYSAQTATATMGQAFTAPTLNNPNNLTVTYSSSKEGVATISSEGVVIIVSEGETTIKATFTGNETYEAAEASYVLTVNKDKTTLAYSAQTATATMGQAFTAPTLNNPNNLTITYSSSKEGVATISSEGVVTIVGAGETTIKASFAGNETYEAAEASYTLTVSKAQATLAYSTDKATAIRGEIFTAPTLNNPNKLNVTYTSSNEEVATINTEGKVTINDLGQTVITATFAGNETYEAGEASYTLTVVKGVGFGYALWIDDTQVLEENCENILGDRSQTFVFNPKVNTLVITNNHNEDIVIESRLDKLTIYLNGQEGNKLKKVFYNNLGNAENKGQLMFTTNFNVPGTIDLKNDEGESVITGFESVEFDVESQLTFVLPEKTTYKYENGEMKKIVVDENNNETTSAAEELSIGQLLTPIDETVTFTMNTLYLKDEDGHVIVDDNGQPKLPNLVNSVVDKVLITLPASIDANSDEGISVDDSDGRVGITIQTESMTDAKAKAIAQKVIDNKTTNTGYFPGSDDFANEFAGMTILLPACTGSIETELAIEKGYEFHLLIAEENQGKLKSTIKVIGSGKKETPFDVAMPSYCYIYMVKTGAGTRLGKRDKAHGKVYSVGVSVTKARSVNPPSEASGNALPESEDPNVKEETSPTPSGITTVNSEQQAVKSGWYTLDGQKIAEPKQRGLYIKDGKKVVIK